MSKKITIAVDAMGGDNSPQKVIDGIIKNHQSNKDNFFKIFGNEPEIKKYLIKNLDKEFYEIADLGQPRYLFGQDPHKFQITATCRKAREGVFNAYTG